MMIVDLKFNGKIRLWFDEDNKTSFKGDKIICKDYLTNSNKRGTKKTIIVEIFLPRGGRNIYGLLGAEYNTVQSEVLKVTVNSTNKIAKLIFNNSLIKKIETVYIGLPYEYNQSIVNRIDSHYKNKALILNGELNFHFAAFTEISSNRWIFSKLTDILLVLLQTNKEDINSDMIMKILD